jgi:hypothetical protein
MNPLELQVLILISRIPKGLDRFLPPPTKVIETKRLRWI